MRLIVGGGRAAEMPNSKGAVVLGVRTLSEGGRVGNFSREQVHKSTSVFVFCVFMLLCHCMRYALSYYYHYDVADSN